MSLSENLLSKVAQKLGQPPSYAESGAKASILAAAASSYGAMPGSEEVTRPTGFDPSAAALFEAIVESAYLVAYADGEFDEVEQKAFKHVVLTACHGMVLENQMSALLADLSDQLEEDGQDKRIEMVAKAIRATSPNVDRTQQAREVLRVAAFLAAVSGGVSDEERDVMNRLTAAFELGEKDLEAALDEAARALDE